MDPEIQPPLTDSAPQVPSTEAAAQSALAPEPPPAAPDPWETRAVRWIFLGSQGLRAGWSVALFIVLMTLIDAGVGFAFFKLHLIDKKQDFTAASLFYGELLQFLGMVGAAVVVALIMRRRFRDYYLAGPRRAFHFFSGLAMGFLALSALIGVLDWGHWLHFGPVALSGAAIFKFGAVWGAAFLLVGCVEEGTFRCVLQSILTRGINFWWALGAVGLICASLLIVGKGNSVWGVYAAGLLGLGPCLALHLKKTEGSGFWQAAWVTCALFGLAHVGNGGENWIGIFAAAGIGFVFCVSIRLTGSAWWAIGFHAAWDWAETYFYGAPDSGNVATGHYLTTSPAGNVFWSGGTDGPEGSVLILAVLLLLLALLIALYGRGKRAPATAPTTELAGG